jgi:pseudaminic acid cytidylyltransferase
MRVAVITARGGSKRIPGKNSKMFAGKPMLAWPILTAQAAGIFDRILVSTDSPDIAAVARQWGADVPFMRPADLADDHTPTAPVFLHALEFLIAEGAEPECACCIYPTAPFLLPEYLRQGLAELREHKAPAALSVTTFEFPVLRCFKRCEDGSVAFNWPEYELARSQDLPEFYHDAGQFYWVDVREFRRQQRLIMPGTRPVVLPRKRVQDLDTSEDWEAAELMAHVLLRGNKG